MLPKAIHLKSKTLFVETPSHRSLNCHEIFYRDTPKDLLKQAERQSVELLEISRNNVQQVMERGAKLSDLKDRANYLEFEADKFLNQIKAMQRRERMKRIKRKIAIFSFLAVSLLIVIRKYIHTNTHTTYTYVHTYRAGPTCKSS